MAVQRRDGPIRLGRVVHFHECETARAPGVAIRYQADPVNRSVGLKQRTDGSLGSRKIQIAYKNILHVVFLCLSIVGLDGADGQSAKLLPDFQKAFLKRHL
jgi:hypothetical protein